MRLVPRPPSAAAAPAALLLLLAGCAGAAPVTVCLPGDAEVPVVASGEEGVWAREGRRARLVELWRAGGLNEGEELVYPVSLAVSPEGRVAVADFSLSELVVIDPDGSWRGPWARRGQGPGELSLPVAAAWGSDGTLAVYDLTGSKVIFLREGAVTRSDVAVPREVAGIISLAGELPWAGVQPHGAVVLQPPSRPPAGGADGSPRVVRILRYAPGAERPDTVLEASHPPGAALDGLTAPGWPRLTAAVGTDGLLAIGGADFRYRISVFDSAGRPLRELCRETSPLPMTPRERGAEASAELAEELAALRQAPLPDTLAAFGRLFWGARGRLWVQRQRTSIFTGDFLGAPGGPYDVFDAEGHYLGEVLAPDEVRLQGAAGDTVFGFVTGALDETSIVGFELVVE